MSKVRPARFALVIAAAGLAGCAGSTANAPADAVTLDRHEHPLQGDSPTAVPPGDSPSAAFRGGQLR